MISVENSDINKLSEGFRRYTPEDKTKFYLYSRGSFNKQKLG